MTRQNTSTALARVTRLDELESIIERGLTSFVETADALIEVRDNKLYKERGHKTFQAYLDQRYKISRSYAHRLIESAQATKMLSIDNKPVHESQARELALVAKSDGPEAVEPTWTAAQKASGTSQPAAREIRAVRPHNETAGHKRQAKPIEMLSIDNISDTEQLELQYTMAQLIAAARQHNVMLFYPDQVTVFLRMINYIFNNNIKLEQQSRDILSSAKDQIHAFLNRA